MADDVKERDVVKIERGRFQHKGLLVSKRGDVTHYSDGSQGLQLHIPICSVWEHLENGAEAAKCKGRMRSFFLECARVAREAW